MRFLTLFLAFFLLIPVVRAQTTLTIDATEETEIPADRIAFRIQMNAEAKTPQEAFELHKEREEVLVKLLNEHDIAQEQIRFQPVSMHKRQYPGNTNIERNTRIVTRQLVSLELEDFDTYEKIQVTLINNGFDEFNGQFLSSEIKKGEDRALKEALRTARRKAELIAEETGSTIRNIKKMHYSYNTSRPDIPGGIRIRGESDSGLFGFDQTVTVSATVTVEYRLQ